jgi:hypothetical protein
MMGFSDGWATDLVPRRAALRLMGNAVVPMQAEFALRCLGFASDRAEAHTAAISEWVVQMGTAFVLVEARTADEAVAAVDDGNGLWPATVRPATADDRERFARDGAVV